MIDSWMLWVINSTVCRSACFMRSNSSVAAQSSDLSSRAVTAL